MEDRAYTLVFKVITQFISGAGAIGVYTSLNQTEIMHW
jgi:hypothetical protein